MAVEVHNLSPLKCNETGCMSSKLLRAVCDLIIFSSGTQNDVESGVTVVEAMLKRALVTSSGGGVSVGATGVLVDDTEVSEYVYFT